MTTNLLSVIEQQQGEIDALRQALVYVAHAGHVTPLHMLPRGVMLCDGDGVVVRVPNGPEVWGGNVSDYEKRRLAAHPQATEPAPSTAGEYLGLWEIGELVNRLKDIGYPECLEAAALLQSPALPVGELTGKVFNLPIPASASNLKSDIVELIQSHKYKGLRSIEVLGVFQFLGAEIISGSNS